MALATNPIGILRGLPPTVRLLVAGTFVNKVGSFIIPYLTLVLRREFRLDDAEVGRLLLAYGAGSLVSILAGGYLTARWLDPLLPERGDHTTLALICLLLSADLKRRPRALANVAWFIVAIRLVDLIWIVAPNFNQGGMPVSLANVGIPVALGGVWVFLFAAELRKHPLVPVNDPYFKDMLAHAQQGGH